MTPLSAKETPHEHTPPQAQGARQRLFAGAYTHRLVRDAAAGFRIRQKRVDLVNCDAQHEAIQIFI